MGSTAKRTMKWSRPRLKQNSVKALSVLTKDNESEVLWKQFPILALYLVVFAIMCTLVNLYFPGAERVCYLRVGCFNVSKPWSERPNVFNFFPQSPNAINTTFIFASRRFPNGKAVKANIPNLFSFLDTFVWGGGNIVFIIHGFTDDSTTWMQDLKNTYLDLQDITVILVDWSSGASGYYPQVVANTRVVAREIAIFISRIDKFWTSHKRIHLVGHSLGSHIASYVGKARPSIFQITALDPALPLFEGFSPEICLNKSDAKHVLVIHSNVGPWGLGMKNPAGTIDVYLNNGRDQRGCTPMTSLLKKPLLNGGWEKLTNFKDLIACSHRRAYEVLDDILNKVTNLSTSYIAYPMEARLLNTFSFCKRKRDGCWKLISKTETFFSLPELEKSIFPSPPSSLSYYIPTSETKPFCVRLAHLRMVTCPTIMGLANIKMSYDGFGEDVNIHTGDIYAKQEVNSWVELSCSALNEENLLTIKLSITHSPSANFNKANNVQLCLSSMVLSYFSIAEKKTKLLKYGMESVFIPLNTCYIVAFLT